MADDKFSDIRIEYGDEPLRRADLPADPVQLFRTWHGEAVRAEVREPNGMAVATCDEQGQPHCRILLLKQVDERGFVFFTNKQSDKGRQLAANQRAAATFWWSAPRNRQVRITGTIEHVPAAESDAYFRSRPRRAQLCSAASPQSRVVESRAQLEQLVATLEQRLGDGEVERPEHWGGYVLQPLTIEFWQGRNGRLHDRFRFTCTADGWSIDRLGS